MSGPGAGGEGEPIAEMNVIPFIDICLVLLIIVLVTATFSTQLLDFESPGAARTDYVEAAGAVTVDVGPDGRCTVSGKAADLGALGDADVVIRASGTTPSRHVVAAADRVRAAGRGRLSFVVRD